MKDEDILKYSIIYRKHQKKLSFGLMIAIIIISVILIGVGFGIARGIDKGIGTLNNYYGFSIVFGLVLLLLSLFIEYPVELEESRTPIEVEPTEEKKE